MDGHNVWVIDQACSVKMAGYWPSSYFACFWTLTLSWPHKVAKKEGGKYPAILTEQAWSIYGFWGNFLAGYSGRSRASKIAPSCRLASKIQMDSWFYDRL